LNNALIVAAGMPVALLGAAGWLVLRHPLRVLNWSARRSLKGAGLRQASIPSPVGPQCAFVGGSGPVLALLHGAGDQAGTWARVVPALVRKHTLVIPDLAGHGASAPAAGPIEAAAVVAGLEAVLASLAPGQRVTLVGNSLGAWMAMVLAARHPERTERVVAVNGGALKLPPSSVNLLPRNREEARESMARLRDPGSAPIPDRVLDELARRSRGGSLARFAATAAGMEAWVLDEAQLRTLALPVRLLWGTSDQLLPLDYAQRMLAALPDARLITIDQCGHIPQQEAPGRFLAALDRALHDQVE
jgi:pimeloyl-ACP methyl ester carboxylesterase